MPQQIPNKKAVTTSTLISILIIIVGFFVVTGVMNRGISLAKGPTAESLCRGSVIAKNSIDILPTGLESRPTPLLCKTEEESIDIPAGAKEKNEAAMRELANLATKCWWQFARGGEGAYRNTFSVGFTNQLYCFVCYNVELKGMDYGSFTGMELKQWMDTNTYSQIAELAEEQDEEKREVVSYLYYIQNMEKSNDAATGWLEIPQDTVFEEGRKYSIAFVEPHIEFGVPNRYQSADTNGIVIADASALFGTSVKQDWCTERVEGATG